MLCKFFVPILMKKKKKYPEYQNSIVIKLMTQRGKKNLLSAVKNHPAKTGTDLDMRLVIIKLNKNKAEKWNSFKPAEVFR